MERNERLGNFAIVSRDIDESVTVLLEVMTQWTIFQKLRRGFTQLSEAGICGGYVSIHDN